MRVEADRSRTMFTICFTCTTIVVDGHWVDKGVGGDDDNGIAKHVHAHANHDDHGHEHPRHQ